jgi:chemotaxis signal transduction protein
MAAVSESAVVAVEARQEALELLLAFPVADQWFALPAQNVMAVVEADRLQPLADDFAGLVGYVGHRGLEVLVRDMTAVLVPGASGVPAEQIILFRGLSSWAGLTTAGTAEMVSVPAEQIEDESDSDHILCLSTGSWRTGQRRITVLDPELLLSAVRPACQN